MRQTSEPPPEAPSLEDGASDRLPAAEGYAGIPRSALRVSDLVIGTLIAIAAILVGTIAVGLADPSIADPNGEASTGAKLAAQAVVVIAFIGTALGYAARSAGGGLSAAARSLGLRPFGPRIILPILAAIGLYLLSAMVLNLIISPQQEDLAENLGADRDAAAAVTVLAGILIIAGAAAGEELFFRGFIFGGLRQTLSLWPAAVISGIFFGLLHLTAGNLAVGLQLSAFGVILAWLYERTGVLWAPMILHGLNNAIAFTLLVTDTI
jgi:membrane protease YdiL (CAAX protease family)